MTARQSLEDVSVGLLAPWRALAFLARRPASWRLALVPAGIACAALVLLGALFVHFAFRWVDGVIPPTRGAFLFLLRTTLQLIALVVSTGVALFASLTLASPLSSASLDALVRVYDAAVGAPPGPAVPWTQGAARALASSLVGIAIGGPVAVLIAIVDFVVPAAAVVLVPLGTLVGGYVLAWNLLDYPLGLRGVTLGDRARWMGRHAALVTGFAVSASTLLVLPGLGLLLLPAGVIGAAIVVDKGGIPGDQRFRVKNA